MCFVHSYATITVDSVTTKASNCANDGIIDVYAHSPSPMVYALVAGQEIRPPQSGSQFAALAAGNYQVMITNFSNDTSIANVTVGGNYTFPDFAPTYQEPFCPNTPTGIIVGNATPAGKPPYTWHLTDNATNQTTIQANDTFYNLPAGSYSIRQYDSCLNFATRHITLTDPIHDFIIGNINNRLFDCDSVELYIQLFVDGGNYALPYTIQIQTANGTYQHVVTEFYAAGYYPDIYERVGGVTYGDYCNFTITDACGNSQSKTNIIAPFYLSPYYGGATDSCQPKNLAYFSVHDPNLNPNVSPTAMHPPVTVTMYNHTTGAFIDSVVNGVPDTAVYIAFSPYGLPGQMYDIQLVDGCGFTYNTVVQMPVAPAPTVNHFFTNNSCFDSTNSYGFQWKNYFYSIPKFELLSGPKNIKATKSDYEYTDTIIYPQIHPVYMGGNNGTGEFSHYTELVNLGIGTYHYRVTDSCGNTIIDSFTVRPQDVSDFNYNVSYEKGCPGQNRIRLSRTTNIMDNAFFEITGNGIQSVVRYGAIDSVLNLNSGTYYVYVHYYRSGSFLSINDSLYCNDVLATVVIPPYDLPKIDYAIQTKCNGTVNVGLLPDSSKGVAPYTYEILSGPETSSAQASNFFTLTQPGNYVARISDVCGFARTFSFFVDTLSFQQIVKIGSSCIGNTTTLIGQHSPYATYVWKKPSGTTYIGDSLRISPVTTTDYGIYEIMKIVSVNNCRDTFYATYTLNSSSMNYTTASICAGNSVTFSGDTLTQAGVYYDTIPGPLCDSIVVLTLTVGVSSYDSVSQTICPGQSVTVGSHTYNSTGVYRDTLVSSAGCDSIYVLNLQVNSYKRDSVSQTICYGQSITVGTHTYNTPGIYRDTIPTTGCDSIHIMNLQVAPEKRDSVSRSICSGQSVTVGTHTYTITGIYRDTIPTANCDSIHVLNLQVDNFKRDSLTQTICEGSSVTVGGIVYSAAGIYRDTIPTSGCDSIFTFRLIVTPTTRDTLNLSICNGESISVGSNTYNAAGVYTDTLLSSTGCDSIISLTLQVNSVKYDSVSIAFCEGDSIKIGGYTYSQAGIYTDTFSTSTCDSIRTVYVSTYPKPSVQITPGSANVVNGDTLQLNAIGHPANQYYWTGNAAYDNAYAQNPIATLYQSSWIVVQATSVDNCVAYDSIYVTSTACEDVVFIPNAFTPNGDGNNDFYRIYGRCIQLNSLMIFNRWGEKVWETADMERGWDGNYKGAPSPVGVYVYVVKYSAIEGGSMARDMKGSLTLIR